MERKQKYSLFGLLILIIFFFIFRPLFYTLLISFFGVIITFLIYKKFKPSLNKTTLLLDSSLLFPFVVIPLILILLWFLVPFLLQFLFNLYSSYQISFLEYLINLVSKVVLNFPTFLLYTIMIFLTPLIFLKIICIINAFKLKKYFWLILLIIFSPIEILYYFLIGRDSLKKEKTKLSKK